MSVPTVQYTKKELAYVEQLQVVFNRISSDLGEDHAINMLLNILWSVGEQRGWHKIGLPLTNLLEHVVIEVRNEMMKEIH